MPHPFPPLAQRVVRSDQVMFQELDGEAVLLDLASEQYFGLDRVGTRIWHLLDEHDTLESVHAALCREYDAPPERIADDLRALVDRLAEAGLVTLE